MAEIAGHREGEYAIGSSKTQHFIQHIRDHTPDNDPNNWRDEQEKWAEAAQLSICEELTCPVCKENCRLLTQQHWDNNRQLQGHTPKYPESEKISLMLCKHTCSNPEIKKVPDDIMRMK